VQRALLILLHSRGIVTADAIYARARNQVTGSSPGDVVEANVQVASRGSDQERRRVVETAAHYVAYKRAALGEEGGP